MKVKNKIYRNMEEWKEYMDMKDYTLFPIKGE